MKYHRSDVVLRNEARAHLLALELQQELRTRFAMAALLPSTVMHFTARVLKDGSCAVTANDCAVTGIFGSEYSITAEGELVTGAEGWARARNVRR